MSRVLIVDDERSIRLPLSRFLQAAGYEVGEAEDLPQAEALLAQQTYDVVLADVVLPQGSGLGLLPRLRTHAPATRVILMTGAPTLEHAVAAMRAGAYDYLAKPVLKDALLRVVAEALAGRDEPGATAALLPCPFCGGPVLPTGESVPDGRGGFAHSARVLCPHCAFVLPAPARTPYASRAEADQAAAARWNRRAPFTP